LPAQPTSSTTSAVTSSVEEVNREVRMRWFLV
jgi:hypothetical protein